MEGFTAFLVTQSGQYLCWAFLFIGVVTTPIEIFYFNNVAKKIKNEITHSTSIEQREIIEKRIKNIGIVKLLVTNYGIAFIVFAVFGLTR